jgi:hypothetical protein
MRSGLIFRVSARFTNRYLLCRMLSASARKMYRQGSSASQSINRSLQALYDAEEPGKKSVSSTESTTQLLEEREAVLAP